MEKTLLQKMFAKPAYVIAILHTPKELIDDLKKFNQNIHELTTSYTFILSFYIKKQELEEEVSKLKNALTENGLLWIAYPKGKSLETDLNRDILRELLQQYHLEAVSLVSLNDTWSAMRFKQV